MGMPAMTLTNQTATGDVITGPGAPTIIVGGLPVATMTSMAAGAVCVSGVITSSVSPTVLMGGLPVATITSMVTGVSAIGVPVATMCAVSTSITKIL